MKDSFYKDLAEMAQEALDELDTYDRVGKSPTVFERIRMAGTPCLEGKIVKPSVMDDVPPREQLTFKRAVFAMAGLESLSGQRQNHELRSYIEFFKNCTSKLSQRSRRPGAPRIFYSWQSTLPGNGNRYLIRAGLSKAIEQLNQELSVEERGEATLDSDTANTPGSPDIIRTILAKIDVATIFVADITLVNDTQPNANVMFELGYAIKALGESNIILLFNEHYGQPRDLPFDLGLKRAMLYRCNPELDDKAAVRRELASKLKAAIEAILTEPTL